MNRGRISTQVFLYFLVTMFLVIIGCGSSDTPVPTYTISGTVTGDTGVTINLTGAATATTTTDAGGAFSFTGRANGTYTVTPVKKSYTFTPTSLAVNVSGANVTGTNFVATANLAMTYGISGTVSGAVQAGVTMTLSGANTGSVATGVDGTYTISGLVPGNYTVTPSKTGNTFTPSSTAVTIAAANSPGNNFVAAAIPVAHNISGTVSGDTSPGVTITVTGTATATATTAADGTYTVTGLYDGGYTVTPSKTGYTFTPSSSAVTVSGANITGKNFVATLNPLPTYSISGAVSGDVLAGVTITTLSSAGSATTTTNASGNYSFSGVANGNFTVTPSLTGYTFSPTSSAVTVFGANITDKNFVATAVATTFSQADLTGTWKSNMLKTGGSSGNKWERDTVTIDSSGYATFVSCLSSNRDTTCPAANSIRLTIDGNGVISASGAGDTDSHMTMTSNKNFAAGTSTSDSNRYQLMIIQKVVPGTSYSSADLQSKSFVYHQLSVGWENTWRYGTGTIDAGLVATPTSETDPSGTRTPGGGATISVDSNGVVTMGGNMATFQGFLSDNKKTIVGTLTDTWTDSGTTYTDYQVMIIQITGQTYTAGPVPNGIHANHMLACGSTSPAPFWIHYTTTVTSGGIITFSDWVSSNSNVTPTGTTYTGSITSSGTVTIAEKPTYHGQVSHDGKFTVATQTNATGIYSLTVNTK
jgi:hypothetical protein